MATPKRSPFFRLPCELRDAIYDLVALDADALYYEFSLKAGGPVQKKALITSDVSGGCPPLVGEYWTQTRILRMWQTTSEDTASDHGLDRVCKQFTAEYSAALARRIEQLLSFGHDEPKLANFSWMGKKWVRLESTHSESSTAESVHSLTIPVPVLSTRTRLSKLDAVAYFTFRFQDSEELGPREHRFVSLEEVGSSGRFRYTFPQHVLQKLDDLINAADWKSSKNRLKERILWIQYFKRQAVKE